MLTTDIYPHWMDRVGSIILVLCTVPAAPAEARAQADRPPILRVSDAALYDDVVVSGSRMRSAVIAETIRSYDVDLGVITNGLVGNGKAAPADDLTTAERVHAPAQSADRAAIR